MSRAFVKESDDVPELPDRPVSPHPNLVTAHGMESILGQVHHHRTEFAKATEAGDREKIHAAQRELRYWNARQASAEVQPQPVDCDVVRFGCRVTIERDDGRTQTFAIVGEDEADPNAGTLSYVSPLAQALMGKGIGDVVKVGKGEAEILKIERN